MPSKSLSSKPWPRLLVGTALASLALTGCAGSSSGPQLPSASFVAMQEGPGED